MSILHVDFFFWEGVSLCVPDLGMRGVRFLVILLGVLSSDAWITSLLLIG